MPISRPNHKVDLLQADLVVHPLDNLVIHVCLLQADLMADLLQADPHLANLVVHPLDNLVIHVCLLQADLMADLLQVDLMADLLQVDLMADLLQEEWTWPTYLQSASQVEDFLKKSRAKQKNRPSWQHFLHIVLKC